MNKVTDNLHYTAVEVGDWDALMNHSIIHPVNKQKVEGKIFLKSDLNATGTEISFNMLPPNTELPYFHFHHKNEETYVIIKGRGQFQVDNDCFNISAGSVIRVAPEGIRGLRNTSNKPLIYMVIQSKENSLEEYSTDDGERIEWSRVW